MAFLEKSVISSLLDSLGLLLDSFTPTNDHEKKILGKC